MQKRNYFLTGLLLSIVIFAIFSCDNDDDELVYETSDNLSMYGIVKSIKGELLGDVDFHLIFPDVDTLLFSQKTPLPAPSTDNYRLYQNYPNPFGFQTNIAFDLPEDTFVTMEIFDLERNLVDVLINHQLSAGHHYVVWDGTPFSGGQLPNGLYIYRLRANRHLIDEKMMCLNTPLEQIPEIEKYSFGLIKEGRFSIHYDNLPINRTIPYLNEYGEQLGVLTITNIIKMAFLKKHYEPAIAEVELDQTECTYFLVFMFPQNASGASNNDHKNN